MTLIREILLAVESGNDSSLIDDFEEAEIKYHQALAIEAKLVEGSVTFYIENATEIPSAVHVGKLTWEGHEFIDLMKQQKIWSTIQSEFKEASFSTVLSVSKELAEGWAKKKVQELIG